MTRAHSEELLAKADAQIEAAEKAAEKLRRTAELYWDREHRNGVEPED